MNNLNIQEELHERIIRCLELIENTEERLSSHKSWENPDRLAILQFTELKEGYTSELILLLAQAGVRLQLAQAA
jgi:hypothetical protein